MLSSIAVLSQVDPDRNILIDIDCRRFVFTIKKNTIKRFLNGFTSLVE
jgi:hypothetical protein